jgi:hypothetical protein
MANPCEEIDAAKQSETFLRDLSNGTVALAGGDMRRLTDENKFLPVSCGPRMDKPSSLEHDPHGRELPVTPYTRQGDL